ncbi:hypothetical protein FHS95_003782 [Sphingomonas naasensis]|uniref:Uncharacterized protein n=1 Tax=Sphingomonas naasensis TaxID=1344951 RepID=A0A4S1WIW4_9SPHN|nr:hypothetical protein [Sphingomonas naasensis]NIJ22071.1 hypothetical protein [Sphingomonas naasensis]TGX42255.1 hypothetical protein E5A74_10390 [Sphingomonas naasensis]
MHNQLEIAQRHVQAVARMLLGHKSLKPGVLLSAGGPVDWEIKLELACLARDSDCDLVHLSLDDTEEGYRMTGIHICAPRDVAVHSYSDCRLSMIGNRTVIIPAQGRGYFVLSSRELIHKAVKPDNWEDGLNRADQRLRELVAHGVDTAGQIAVHAIAQD